MNQKYRITKYNPSYRPKLRSNISFVLSICFYNIFEKLLSVSRIVLYVNATKPSLHMQGGVWHERLLEKDDCCDSLWPSSWITYLWSHLLRVELQHASILSRNRIQYQNYSGLNHISVRKSFHSSFSRIKIQ